MIAIDELTIDQAHTAFKSGAFTCRELVEAYLERIKTLDKVGPRLNAITTVSSFALNEADVLDAYFKSHGLLAGLLHGIPVIIKDQCDTKGIETTYGNLCCKHVPTEDSTLVRKLKEAGAVILAKSTMPGRSHIQAVCTQARLDSSFSRFCGIFQFCVFSQRGDFEPL
jgi:Asp-tRNA(Asn)/Glu-tRNA(Gln) amidotransferase A subunit family amidase